VAKQPPSDNTARNKQFRDDRERSWFRIRWDKMHFCENVLTDFDIYRCWILSRNTGTNDAKAVSLSFASTADNDGN